jgi:hypothetical protein
VLCVSGLGGDNIMGQPLPVVLHQNGSKQNDGCGAPLGKDTTTVQQSCFPNLLCLEGEPSLSQHVMNVLGRCQNEFAAGMLSGSGMVTWF